MTTHLRLISKEAKDASLDRHGPNIGYVARAHLKEVAKLARKAEWWGAPPQGERLMGFAYHLDQGTMLEAAAIRDQIRDDLRTARLRIIFFPIAVLAAAIEGIPDALSALGDILLTVLTFIPVLAIIGAVVWFFFLR